MTPSYGDDQIQAWRAFGLKPLIATALLLPGVNPLARAIGRRILPAGAVERLPLRAEFVSFRLLSGDTVRLLHPERDLFAKDVFWGRGRPTSPADDRVLRLVERLAQAGGTFLDIGSYSGAFAMIAAKANPKLRSVAYEIVPENFLLMVENVIANDLNSQIDLRLIGLGAVDSVVTIPVRLKLASNATSISLSSEFRDGNRIPVRTLDGESQGWIGPVVMKIDVEGFELEIFEGGQTALERFKPDIVCEILGTQAPEKVRRIEALMRRLGYRAYQSEDVGFIKREQIAPSMDAKDWLFTCRDDMDEVLSHI
jgi:FkbM family methyltransferase